MLTAPYRGVVLTRKAGHPGVVHAESEAFIAGATAAEVFDFVLDPATLTKADKRYVWVTKLADLPDGMIARADGRLFGRLPGSVITRYRWLPPHLIEVTLEHGLPQRMDASITIEELDGGTVLRQVEEVEMPGPLARLWAKAARRWFSRSVDSGVTQVAQLMSLGERGRGRSALAWYPRQRPHDGTVADHDWDAIYRQAAAAPWDIGRPQPVFEQLAAAGLLSGSLLDSGCGTGDHALLAARTAAPVLGVDISAAAIETARRKAADQQCAARFEVGDVRAVSRPDAEFDTIVDSGMFHVLDDEDRARYVGELARLLRPGGHLYLMCFSDRQPGDWGPRRVSEAELRSSFDAGWVIERIEPAEFHTNPTPGGDRAAAWLLRARRV